MKNIQCLFLFLLPLALASCVNTREELEIKGDGSGTLVMKTDLSKLMELSKSFGGDSAMLKDGMDRPYDTLVLIKDYIDTSKDIPADKKEVLRNGKLHIVLNTKENIGKIDMNFPFASADKLQLLYASLNKSTGGLKNILNGMGKSMPKGPDEESDSNNAPEITAVYDIVLKNGLYSRKVNKARYDDFASVMKLDDLKQLGGMFGEMDYTLVITLPKPVKKITNSQAVLSQNKKTVTLKGDLMEVFQHPEILALDIAY